MPKSAEQRLLDRLNKSDWEGRGNNDDAFDAQERARARRRNLRMVHALVPLVEDDKSIETAFDRERAEREYH